MTDPHPAARQTQAIVADLAKIAPRIDTALTQLARDASPLKASAGGIGGTGDYSDPTATTALDPQRDQPTTARRRILQLVRNLDEDSRALCALINTHAAVPAGSKTLEAENAGWWCKNHKQYGINVAVRDDGDRTHGRHCRWCQDIYRNYGKYPNSKLIKFKARQSRLSERDIERELGVKRKKEPA
jgi:hypothetical protein